MAAGVLSYLRHLGPAVDAELADGELLRRFHGSEQAAFTELLRRHGPLVWGVCRRALGDGPAAEDVFQATFLQLAQRARTLRGGTLAGWLHTVATRLAARARLAEQRRRRRERGYTPPPSADDRTWWELRQVLDTEIARLPEAYRQPLILCYLENLSRVEAARRLGLTGAVLHGRLERGRQKLRQRLEKLGLPLAALLLTATDPVPTALAATTQRTVFGALAGAPVSPAVAALAGGAFLYRIRIAVLAVLLLVAGVVGLGSAVLREPLRNAETSPARGGVDALGDPLPAGALLRLGTRRHRVQTWPLAWHDLPDGKSYLIYQQLGPGNEIRRLDAVTGRVLETWRVPDWHHAAGFSPDGRHVLLSTSFVSLGGLRLPGVKQQRQWELTLYDLGKRKTVWENRAALEENDWKHVESAWFSPDGKWIATTGEYGRGSLRLWNAATGAELWHRKQDVQKLEPLGFIKGGAMVVLREANDNAIYLLDRGSGKQLRSFPTIRQRETWQCGLAPDGLEILFGGSGPSVRTWDVATGKEKRALGGRKHRAGYFAFSPDGKTIVTGAKDSSVQVRSWPSGKVIRTIDLGRQGLERMAVCRDGRRLAVMFAGEQALHFYDLRMRKEQPASVEGHTGAVYGVALAPEGTLLSLGKDGMIRTWDLAARKAVGRLAVEQDLNAGAFALSGDGRWLATASSDNHAIDVYERITGRRLRRLPTEHNVGNHLVFSPDGRWLAGDQRSGGIIQVWDLTRGRTVLRHKHEDVYWVPCAFSPDSRQFAAAGPGRVGFWEVGTWKEQPSLAASAAQGLAYSPDGRILAVASEEGVRLFERATGRERVHIRPKGYPAGVLQFSPTGRWLAWTSFHRTIHVWDVRGGKMLGSFTGHDDAITGLAFTADDCGLASSSVDSTLLVWDLAGAAAKESLPRKGR